MGSVYPYARGRPKHHGELFQATGYLLIGCLQWLPDARQAEGIDSWSRTLAYFR